MNIDWALYTELAAGRNDPDHDDVVNRPLRQVLTASGYDPDQAFAGFAKTSHVHSAADITSGALAAARGGTGLSSPTAGALLVAAGIAAMTVLAPGASGQFVRSNGSAWAAGAVVTADISDLASAATAITKVGALVQGSIGSGFTSIADAHLDTISTSGKVANSATTATASNSPSTIVLRDASGNFHAGTISADVVGNVTGNVTGNLSGNVVGNVTGSVTGAVLGTLVGNASTATVLASGRTIAITGDLAYTSPAFDGSGNVTAAGTLATVNTNVGSFGSASAVGVFTVNGKGLITAASSASITAPAGALSGTTLASNVVNSSLTAVGVLASPHVTSLTVDSGGITVTAGSSSLQAVTVTTVHATTTSLLDGDVTLGARLVFSAATGKVVPGATSLAFRDTADANSNLVIADAGAITVRSTISGVTTLTATTLAGTLSTAAQPNITSTGILAALHMTSPVVDSGGIAVTAGGVTVSSGTTAVQAFTATTGVFSSTLQSTGFTATTGAFSSTLAAAGDFAIATTKFTVTASSGNTSVAGTLAVSGTSTFAAVNGTTGAFSGAVSMVGLSSSSGFTVSSGASSLQAVTATTGVFSSTLGVTGDFTINTTRFTVVAASGNTTIAGTLGVTGAATTGAHAVTGTLTVTSASSASAAVGPNGTTNPVWQIDSSTASQAAGLQLTGATSGGTVALAVISSASNANLSINARGSGTIAIGSVSTGGVTITPATTVTGALNVNGNFTASTAGALSGITTIATSSTINSQTISATASFTGTVTIATGLTVSAGTSAVQALTATTGAFTSTLTSGAFTATAASGQITAQANVSPNSPGIRLLNGASSGNKNWLIAGRLTTANSLEFVPSTAADGTTFSDPTLILTPALMKLALGVDFQIGAALVALGAGASATLGTIGGSGPATAAQNSWALMKDTTGASFWVPAWK